MMDDGIIGKKELPTKEELEFWDRFSELLADDPEDKHNNLIRELRIVAQEWFASEDKKGEE